MLGLDWGAEATELQQVDALLKTTLQGTAQVTHTRASYRSLQKHTGRNPRNFTHSKDKYA